MKSPLRNVMRMQPLSGVGSGKGNFHTEGCNDDNVWISLSLERISGFHHLHFANPRRAEEERLMPETCMPDESLKLWYPNLFHAYVQ